MNLFMEYNSLSGNLRHENFSVEIRRVGWKWTSRGFRKFIMSTSDALFDGFNLTSLQLIIILLTGTTNDDGGKYMHE